MRNNIHLVNPPLFDVERPSIALGVLATLLRGHGFKVTVDYMNMWSVECLGLGVSLSLTQLPTRPLIDWLFGRAAFPDFHPDDEAFFELFAGVPGDEILGVQTPVTPAARARLLRLRETVTGFVDDAARRILRDRPSVVGCSSTFNQHIPSLALLRRIRELDPEVVTVIGGANCEGVMGLTTHREFPWVDYVVSGEAEELVVPLFAGILENGRDMPLAATPFGVFAPAHREAGYPASDCAGPPRASVQDMTKLPTPDYSDYFRELGQFAFKNHVIPGLLIETARGCWWGERSHCTFCGLNGGNMKFRSKPVDVVMKEMETLIRRHDIPRIEAVDNIIDVGYFTTLLPHLRDCGDDLTLFYETKTNLKRETVKLFAESGLRWIQPGIESLDSRPLKLMRKGAYGWQGVMLLKWCRQYGVSVFWNLLTGVPGEEDDWYEDMADLFAALVHLQPGTAARIQYHRFSPYHSKPDEFGLKLRPNAIYQHIYPLDEAVVGDLVYFFENTVETPGTVLNETDRPGWTRALRALGDWRKAWTTAPRPVCCVQEIDGVRYLFDTRPCARSPRRVLDPLADRLLTLGDSALTLDAFVREACAVTGRDEAAVRERLGELVADRLALILDGRVLSVVLETPVARLPKHTSFPGGMLSATPLVERVMNA